MNHFVSNQVTPALKSAWYLRNLCGCQSRTGSARTCDLVLKLPCPLMSLRCTRFYGTYHSRCLGASSSVLQNSTGTKYDTGTFRNSAAPVQLHSLDLSRSFRTFSPLYCSPLKPSSRVEETVSALKEKAKEKVEATKKEQAAEPTVVAVPPKKSLKQKIKDELLHYYHGFRLLGIDIKVSSKLVWRVLNGKSLSRREYNLLVRTMSDMFRLVPFSVFIIVPFMEFLLPVFIKFFPGMLPSTFQTSSDKEAKIVQNLKIKLEMAKFLQKTLDNMSVHGVDDGNPSESAAKLAEFFKKVKESGGIVTSEEILKMSKLFRDEITLDSLSKPQLAALCRVLEIQPIGTSNVLRFQLRMKLRSLAADDIWIRKEGIDSLSVPELQAACRARGMRAYGLTAERLKEQLEQWIHLSLNEKVPPSLLLLSRALMLSSSDVPLDQIKATISALPETMVSSVQAEIGEIEGKPDNKLKIALIQEEVRKISEERKEEYEELKAEKKEAVKDPELLEDKAPELTDTTGIAPTPVTVAKAPADVPVRETVTEKVVPDLVAQGSAVHKEEELTSKDLAQIEDAISVLTVNGKKKLLVEKDELEQLKEELADYQADVLELKEALKETDPTHVIPKVKESKAANRLFKRMNKMINQLDHVRDNLEKKGAEIKKTLEVETVEDKKSDELVKIDELLSAIQKIQTLPDSSKLEKIAEVLSEIDKDHDGLIRIDVVLRVLELIGNENVKLNKKQIDELIELVAKEEMIELEEHIAQALKQDMQKSKEDKESESQNPKSGSSSSSSSSSESSSNDSKSSQNKIKKSTLEMTKEITEKTRKSDDSSGDKQSCNVPPPKQTVSVKSVDIQKKSDPLKPNNEPKNL
ncbi:unnamed protein product [Bemisia tabaci]|uniref:Mitochondrial proton/calcium exchanger protein n=1 Tax=Bemisia tabaci TaxID=7038 RepID=A0A9P0ACP7_BEMTA|nr:unnamed protein product [Bemisia tabaci]